MAEGIFVGDVDAANVWLVVIPSTGTMDVSSTSPELDDGASSGLT